MIATATILVAFVLLVLAFGRSWLRWLRLRGGRIRPRYPVVLVHGLMGFDELELGREAHAYFRGVREHLAELGVEVHRVRLPPIGSVDARARALAEFIDGLETKRVNVIAHSMGGLDARYAISKLGLGNRIASLVTVATPHRGTPLADVGDTILDRVGARWAWKRLGLAADGVKDLTSGALSTFNAEITDVDGVFYGCVLTSTKSAHPLLAPTHRWLHGCAGENDGVVPKRSQVWGEVVAAIDADHWAAIGWSDRFDARVVYVDVVRELRARGL